MKLNPQIYSDAAEFIADGVPHACCAISKAVGALSGGYGRFAPERLRFEALYGISDPYGGSHTFDDIAVSHNLLDWWQSLGREGRAEFRIWALCFAHAAATYRRPRSRSREPRFRKIESA